MTQLLEGLKVIDAASFLAGPGAATVLGDYGADVIKVEPREGTATGRCPLPIGWTTTGC